MGEDFGITQHIINGAVFVRLMSCHAGFGPDGNRITVLFADIGSNSSRSHAAGK